MVPQNYSCFPKLSCYTKFFLLGMILIILINICVYYKLNYIQDTLKPSKVFKKTLGNKTRYDKSKVETYCLIGNATMFAHAKIMEEVPSIGNLYKSSYKASKYFEDMLYRLKQGLDENFNGSLTPYQWMLLFSSSVLKSEDYGSIGSFLNTLQTKPIKKAQSAVKGTQLKLLLSLENDLQVIFKPKWYPTDHIVEGVVYSGKDRHYGEMVSFFVSFLLNLPRVPPTITRNINLRTEILPVAEEKLTQTFTRKGNNSCFYGVCFYCTPNETVCAEGDILEGVVTYYLSNNYVLANIKHPWQRSYNCKRLAKWEMDNNYCEYVKNSEFYMKTQNKHLLLDLMEMSVFDFLIDNGDRHHYEFFKKMPTPRSLLLDNGKSFGNPYVDHIDILAPLYQCCMLRKSMWLSLIRLNNGNLSKWLRYLLRGKKLNFQLPEDHFKAIERRLSLIFATLTMCIKQKGGLHNVLVE